MDPQAGDSQKEDEGNQRPHALDEVPHLAGLILVRTVEVVEHHWKIRHRPDVEKDLDEVPATEATAKQRDLPDLRAEVVIDGVDGDRAPHPQVVSLDERE